MQFRARDSAVLPRIAPRATIVDLWRESAAKHPDANAIVAVGASPTRRQLAQAVDALALRLSAAGVGKNTLVIVQLSGAGQTAMSALAILTAGGAFFIPDRVEAEADWENPPAARLLLLDDAAFRALTSAAVSQSVRLPLRPDLADAACVGDSGAGLDHAALVRYCLWHRRNLDWSPDDRAAIAPVVATTAPASFLPPLCLGAALHIIPVGAERDPELLLDYLARNEITHVALPVGTAAKLLSGRGRGDFPAALRCLVGIGSRPKPLSGLADRTGLQVVHEYVPPRLGMTCAVLFATASGRFAGQALSYLRAYILDAGGRSCRVGEPGNLCFSGIRPAFSGSGNGHVDPGFAPNPFFHPPADDEAHAFLYRTGDQARWLRDTGVRGQGIFELDPKR